VQIGVAPRRGPRPGNRAPDGVLLGASGASVRVFELLREPSHALLIFAGPAASIAAVEQARALAARLRGADLRTFVIIGIGSGSGIGLEPSGLGEHADPEGRVHATYGVEGPAAVLLRPDGHIGLRCDPLLEDALTRELAHQFIREP